MTDATKKATQSMASTYRHALGDGRTLVLKNKFRSRLLAELKRDAADLVEQLTSVLIREDDLAKVRATVDAAESTEDAAAELIAARDEIQRSTVRDLLARGFALAVEVEPDELDALHRFCAAVTEDVEGADFTDDEGRGIGWKHLTDDQRAGFYDMEISSTSKVTIFLNAFLTKTGISSTPRDTTSDGDDV